MSFGVGTVLRLDVDWSALPAQLTDYKNFVMNIYCVPSVLTNNGSVNVNRLDDAASKQLYLYLLGECMVPPARRPDRAQAALFAQHVEKPL